jgi:hypothetical protein
VGAESDDNDTDVSCAELGDENELNLTLMVWVEEDLSRIDIDGIIASKNILDNKTIKLLRNMVIFKNKEIESQQQASPSTSPLEENEVFLNFFYDSDDYGLMKCIT